MQFNINMIFWGKFKNLGFLGFFEKNLNLKNANFGGFWPKIENFEYGKVFLMKVPSVFS